MSNTGPHQEQPIKATGTLPENASAAMIMLHGRGSSAENMLSLSNHLDQKDVAYLAPQAAGHTWYPQRFIAPIQANEPYLSSALQAVSDTIETVEKAGIPAEKLFLIGFSQGACLALEYAARNPRRYGGVIGLSGGLIGEQIDTSNYNGSLEETPIFIGCSDVDFHIPLERVKETTAALKDQGADVTERIYPGMGHTINEDEVQFVRQLMSSVLSE